MLTSRILFGSVIAIKPTQQKRSDLIIETQGPAEMHCLEAYPILKIPGTHYSVKPETANFKFDNEGISTCQAIQIQAWGIQVDESKVKISGGEVTDGFYPSKELMSKFNTSPPTYHIAIGQTAIPDMDVYNTKEFQLVVVKNTKKNTSAVSESDIIANKRVIGFELSPQKNKPSTSKTSSTTTGSTTTSSTTTGSKTTRSISSQKITEYNDPNKDIIDFFIFVSMVSPIWVIICIYKPEPILHFCPALRQVNEEAGAIPMNVEHIDVIEMDEV